MWFGLNVAMLLVLVSCGGEGVGWWQIGVGGG